MPLGGGADAPHLPRPAPIDAYGNGGFRFAGMSHRGSLLCFPDGIWAWPITDLAELNEAALRAAFERADGLDFFLIGAGRDPWPLPEDLAAKISRTVTFGRRDGDGRCRANLQHSFG